MRFGYCVYNIGMVSESVNTPLPKIVCMINTKKMGRKKLGRERINITLPEGMADALTEAATEKGWDRSRLLEELATAYLKKREKEKGESKERKE